MPKRRTSAADDIIDIASQLPWWVGFSLALISFVVLHLVANIQIETPVNAKQIGTFAGKQLYVTLAMLGQYVLPALFGFGGLISAIKSQKQKKRFETVKANPSQNSLFDMSWQEFEGLVSEFFKRRGYAVTQTGGNGPDGGVDVIATKGDDQYLVQCKQWKAYKVGVQVVRELYGVMSSRGAAGGFVITAGEFTKEATKFAEGLNIRLFDGTHLHKMIREGQQAPGNNTATEVPQTTNAVPVCSTCGQSMVMRVAKKGRNVGQSFWGCSGFPTCRQTMAIQ